MFCFSGSVLRWSLFSEKHPLSSHGAWLGVVSQNVHGLWLLWCVAKGGCDGYKKVYHAVILLCQRQTIQMFQMWWLIHCYAATQNYWFGWGSFVKLPHLIPPLWIQLLWLSDCYSSSLMGFIHTQLCLQYTQHSQVYSQCLAIHL